MKEVYKKYYNALRSIDKVKKNSLNPHTKSRYASLSNIQEHVSPILFENNLLLMFHNASIDGDTIKNTFNNASSYKDSRIIFYDINVVIVDMISLEELKFKFTVPMDTTQYNPVQGFGSTMTYMQRYIYGVIFQIPFDDEDPDSRVFEKNANNRKSISQSSDENVMEKQWLNKYSDKANTIITENWEKAIKYLKGGGNIGEIEKKYKISNKYREELILDCSN